MERPKVLKSGAEWKLEETEFRRRYQRIFANPVFKKHQIIIDELTDEAWKTYQEGKKTPDTIRAGTGYQNPDYQLSVDWIRAKEAVDEAKKIHEDPEGPLRVLVHDWMNDIFPMWVRAHGIMIITPVYWHQAPSALKLMIDRLVCADGGNPDPTSTNGKDPSLAKDLELNGWNYPRHLQGRVYSLVVHGDTQGVDEVKNCLSSWLNEIMLIPSSVFGSVGRYIGYYGSYAESHQELDQDFAIMEEVQNSAEALAMNVVAERAKKLDTQIPHLHDPRPK